MNNLPLNQFRREIVHLVESNIFQAIKFEHSPCRPSGFNLSFYVRVLGGDCSLGLLRGEIVHIGLFSGKGLLKVVQAHFGFLWF